MAGNSRVIVPDLAPPNRLRVPSLAGDTYAPPARPVINNDLERMASALGSFSSVLAQRTPQEKADERDAARASAERYIAGSTNKQLWDDYHAGRLPRQSNDVANGLYERALGTNLGTEILTEVQTFYGPGGGGSLLTPDGSPKNIDEELSGFAKKYLERLPATSPHSSGAFNAAMSQVRSWALGAQQKYQQERAAQDTSVTVQTDLRGFVGADLSGKTPEQIGALITERTGKAATTLHIPYRDVDDYLMGQLKLALNPDTATPALAKNVLSIIEAPRTGTDGQKLGPLSANPRFADQVANLKADANKVLEKAWKAEQNNELFKGAFDAFQRGDGSFDLIQDTARISPITGLPYKVSSSEIRDGAMALYSTSVRDTAKKQLNGQPPEVVERTAMLEMAPKYIGNGIVNKEWQGALRSAASAASDPTSISDPTQSARIKGAVNLYGELRTRSPAYVDSLLTDKEKDFYEAYTLFRQFGQGDDVALRNAAVVSEPENRQDPGVMQRYEDIDRAIRKQGDKGWLGTTLYNDNDARTRIVRTAAMVARAQGVSAEDALKIVGERFASETPVVNGQAIFVRSSAFTKDRVPVVEGMLSEAYSQFGQTWEAFGIDGPEDLSVRFTGDRYQIVRATDGIPLPIKGAVPFASFTDKQLQQYERKIQLDRDLGILKDAGPASRRAIMHDRGVDRATIRDPGATPEEREAARQRLLSTTPQPAQPGPIGKWLDEVKKNRPPVQELHWPKGR